MTPYIFTYEGQGKQKQLNRLRDLEKELEQIKSARMENDERDGNPIWNSNSTRDYLDQQAYAIAKSIQEIQLILSNSIEIRAQENRSKGKALVGSIVEYKDLCERQDKIAPHIIEIAGYGESDHKSGKVDYSAPLTKAMMGSEVGDICTYEINGEEIEIEIVRLYDKWPD